MTGREDIEGRQVEIVWTAGKQLTLTEGRNGIVRRGGGHCQVAGGHYEKSKRTWSGGWEDIVTL